MKKLLLMSVLYALIILPSLAATHERNAVRGVKRAVAGFVVYNFFYIFVVLVLWTSLDD